MTAARHAGRPLSIDCSGAAHASAAGHFCATGLPHRSFDVSASRIETFVSADSSESSCCGHCLVAALGGLNRSASRQIGRGCSRKLSMPHRASPGATRIMAAAQRRERGTVALLAAVGHAGTELAHAPAAAALFRRRRHCRQVGPRPLCPNDRRRGHGTALMSRAKRRTGTGPVRAMPAMIDRYLASACRRTRRRSQHTARLSQST